MAGNSRRPGARSRGKGNTAGSGGRIRRSLRGKGPTPKAEDRVYHKAYKAKQEALKRQANRPRAKTGRAQTGADWVVGRNPVLEALTAGLPVKQAYVAEGAERDDRLRDILKFAAEHSLPLLQVTRAELDRVTGGLAHQGVALQLPAFHYTDVDDIFAAAFEVPPRGLAVASALAPAPPNCGATIRSAPPSPAQGGVIPPRRSPPPPAPPWTPPPPAAARIPVARVTNLNQMLRRASGAGFTVVGLAGEGDTPLSGIPGLDGPVVVVVGSEGEGLARLVRENCDALVSIPITSAVESLNASVAASIALYEIGQQRVS